MSFIVESIISMLVEKLVSTSTELLTFFPREKQILQDLDEWKNKLVIIKEVLNDAEEKRRADPVKIWLGDLQNLAYDAEDILDEFATQLLRRKLSDDTRASTSKARKQISSYLSSLNPQSILFNSRMASKMKEITTRLQKIVTLKDQLSLEKSAVQRSNDVERRPTTISSLGEAKVYGRDRHRNAIVAMLKDDSSANSNVNVIPITGMGGIGKTTLAKLAYNDVEVVDHFDLKVWVCVSLEFDVTRITKEILKYINPTGSYDGNLSKLQEQLKEKLLKKKFLLVLDDIWSENRADWNSLCPAFEAGSPGSKVIITTRNQTVAKRMATLPDYKLEKLSFEDCFNVFAQQASGQTDFRVHQDLKEIGEKIVERCDGLPLAAEALGGLLRDELDSNKWKEVLNSKIWDEKISGTEILPSLAVSYYYLPSHLKRCFAYCSLFPEDYEFSKEEVTLLWMAEGFLHCKDEEKPREDLGCDYFDNLKSRSFFQPSSKDTSRYVMHDLINNLAKWAAGELCVRIDGRDKQLTLPKNSRYLSYVPDSLEREEKFKAVYDAKHLRTFLPIGLSTMGGSYLASVVLDNLMQLRYLRTLSLRWYKIFELPNEIGELQHLRYLDISCTHIETFPESINTLYNLEALLLEHCWCMKKLCADMGNLKNLRHLNNFKVSLEEMPQGIGKLTGLVTLPNFVVGRGNGSDLEELRSLNHIKGTLCISRLENVNVQESEKASINSKRGINVLKLEWSVPFDDSRETEKERLVLDKLRPHQDLKELSVRGYGGSKFSPWLGDSSFSKLERLTLKYCSKCAFLPPVGQLPSLKHLVIEDMDAVEGVDSEFFNSPSLETLCFKSMKEWEDWIPHGPNDQNEVFPRLRELFIIKCPKLVGTLPEQLPLLERLVIKNCEQLSVPIPSLPELCSLEIKGCKEMVQRSAIDLNSPKSTVHPDTSSQEFPTERITQGLSRVEQMKIVGCKELLSLWKSRNELMEDNSFLRRLEIELCPRLFCLVAEEEEEQLEQELPCRLEYLKLKECESLMKLPQALRNLSLLTEISIDDCPKLISFLEDGMPPQLRVVRIKKCYAVKSLPEAWMYSSNSLLESLSIEECHSLAYISRVQLPLNLRRLEIKSCDKLRTLVDEEGFLVIDEETTNSGSSCNASLLESLEIADCPSLTSLWSKSELPDTLGKIRISGCSNLASLSSRGIIPKALKYLWFRHCSNLKSISEELQNHTSLEEFDVYYCNNFKFSNEDLQNLSHSRCISIRGCPNLVSFPEEWLPSRTLTTLRLSKCENLKALPNHMDNLTSLTHLCIEDCGSTVWRPEDGLPTSLESLKISTNEKICKSLFDWGLDRLTSLTSLSITGGCLDVVSFPHETIRFPASLTVLWIWSFPKLERISSHIQNLTSLRELCLWNCCKLKSFPVEALPSSLLQLYISECPMLEQRWAKDKGKYWPMRARIPFVSIYGEVNYANYLRDSRPSLIHQQKWSLDRFKFWRKH